MIDPRASLDGKLRVLHVLGMSFGVPLRQVADVVREQAARGHDIGLVVVARPTDPQGEDILEALAPALSLGVRKLSGGPGNLADIVRIRQHAARLNVDVVHGHGVMGGLHALGVRKAAAIRCHAPRASNVDPAASSAARFVGKALDRFFASRADLLVFDSLHAANRFHGRVGDAGATVRIAHDGIGSDDFTPIEADADAADFLYVGDPGPSGGAEILMAALGALRRRRGRALSLAAVDDGSNRQRLEEIAAAHGIDGAVRFVDPVPLRNALAGGRVLVVPHAKDPLPRSVVLAAAASVPIVAADFGALAEVFGPYRDRLVRSRDAGALSAALERAIEAGPEELAREAQDLAAFVSARFTTGHTASSILDGYRDALARRAPAADRMQEPVSIHPC